MEDILVLNYSLKALTKYPMLTIIVLFVWRHLQLPVMIKLRASEKVVVFLIATKNIKVLVGCSRPEIPSPRHTGRSLPSRRLPTAEHAQMPQ